MAETVRLATGVEMRLTGSGPLAVACVSGRQDVEVPGTWSASPRWLVAKPAPCFPDLAFAEVRHPLKSWRRLQLCIEDGAAAGPPSVTTGVGLAPSLPERLDLSPLTRRRLAVAHGRLDRPLAGIPGMWPHVFLPAVERARAIGATSILIPGALHGLALRAPWGRPLPLLRAGRSADFVAAKLQRFRRGESA